MPTQKKICIPRDMICVRIVRFVWYFINFVELRFTKGETSEADIREGVEIERGMVDEGNFSFREEL